MNLLVSELGIILAIRGCPLIRFDLANLINDQSCCRLTVLLWFAQQLDFIRDYTVRNEL